MGFSAVPVCLILLITAGNLSAEDALLTHPYQSLSASSAPAVSPNPNWNNERLEYDIYWGAINVGSAYLSIDKIVEISSRPVYHIISGARSSSFINNFYHVADINESWLDVNGLYSHGYYKKIQEGGHFFNEWVLFDYQSMTFRGEKMGRKRNVSPIEGVLDGLVNDVLSSLYVARTMDLAPGGSIAITVNTKKTWPMAVEFVRAEKASTRYGKFKCVVVEPKVGEDGLFVAKQGKRMLVWVTDDALRIPLILKAEIFIGSITAKLSKRKTN